MEVLSKKWSHDYTCKVCGSVLRVVEDDLFLHKNEPAFKCPECRTTATQVIVPDRIKESLLDAVTGA